MSTEVQADWDNREFVEMIERSCRQSVGFLNRFYQSAKYRLAVLDQRLTRVERKLDYIEASLENADVAQRGGNPVPFSGSLFEPESRVDEVKRKLDRRREARGVFTQEVIHPRKTIKKVLTIESRGGRFTTTQATEQKERDEVPRRQQPPTAGGPAGAPPSASRPPATNPGAVPPQQPGPPATQPPPQARAAAAQPTRPTQQPGAGRRGQAAPSQPGAQPGAAPGRRGGPPPTVPSADGPGAGGPPPAVPGAGGPPPAVPKPPEPEKPFPHGDPNRIDMQTVQPGSGPIPKKNSHLEVAYTGWLMDGRQFIEHRETVQLGVGQNIVGLERALLRMTCGQRCKLWIPSGLAYGPAGAGDLIPPNSDLTFDIKLIRIVDQ